MKLYTRSIKRFVDLALSVMLLAVLSPLLVVIWMVLAIEHKGKPFFIQSRVGLRQKVFSMIKFKTMNEDRDVTGALLPDKRRISKVGMVLRQLSLDELPQLVNVLKGDMSIVGPRPLLVRYVPLYSANQNRRHEVRPGITGWAQVNGRNAISWSRRFELDVYYVDHLTFLLDCRIFWMTIIKIIRREGIDQSENRPMEPFSGSN